MTTARRSVLLLMCFFCGCADRNDTTHVRVFHAAGLTSFMEDMRERCAANGNLELLLEASGSQAACRKVSELHRECDLLVLADNRLVALLLKGHCDWRIDFASDEMVLAVGSRAPRVEQAERDWVSVLLAEDVRLARVDENQGPTGYRGQFVLKLYEKLGNREGICDAVLKKSAAIVDDVSRLPPLLRNGQIDYAFMYRSTCMAHSIRFITLDDSINLASPDVDYGLVTATFTRSVAGREEVVRIPGAQALWTLTSPVESSRQLVQCLLVEGKDKLAENGFRVLSRPVFYGTRERYGEFAEIAEYGGILE